MTLGNILFASKGIYGILGYTNEELLTMSINAIIPKIISQIHDKYFHNLFTHGSDVSIAKIIHNFALRKDHFV